MLQVVKLLFTSPLYPRNTSSSLHLVYLTYKFEILEKNQGVKILKRKIEVLFTNC